MLIKEITLNNFRIYKGENTINLLPSDDKNVVVISGENGFGKTTFLMALVWCLYGRQMENVDDFYKKIIEESGGYIKYISKTLNRLAKAENETKFSVSILFQDVKIPEITCNEVRITRSFDDVSSSSDSVEVLIDGYYNELIRELTTDGKQDGEEIFIRDFILPIEVAKFFFFDAEKIVSIAENNSPEQRRALSKAYTEVLGIKKYEDLKDQLESLQDDYRKKSATKEEKKEFNQIETDIKNYTVEIDSHNSKINDLHDEKVEKKSESDEIQDRLIKEGCYITIDQLKQLKSNAEEQENKITELQSELKELFDLIPFGLSGEILYDVFEQLKSEKKYKDNKFSQDEIDSKTKLILDDIENEKKKYTGYIDTDIRDFYERQIKRLIRQYFYTNANDLPVGFMPIHEFSDAQFNEIGSLINNLTGTFSKEFGKLTDEYQRAKSELDKTRRDIRNAEKDSDDEYTDDLRRQKQQLDERISQIDQEIGRLEYQIEDSKNKIKALRQRQENLRKKIDDSRSYSAKDEKTREIISQLKDFINKFRNSTKMKLSENILNELNILMHKKGFIQKVDVEINQEGNDVDINLFDARGQKIDKSGLSKGESQMYASALLKSLVDESDIDFPVFIDSPMQKFDKEHAENVIKEFYPNVSKQVVLFPLIHKELTASEYEILKPNVSRAYLIDNVHNDKSQFVEVNPDILINEYDERYANQH